MRYSGQAGCALRHEFVAAQEHDLSHEVHNAFEVGRAGVRSTRDGAVDFDEDLGGEIFSTVSNKGQSLV